jgi:predicted enzyme related to lactoylglutathione lyase
MANIDQHAPGSFSWIELATGDQTAAKSFYTSLFGWEIFDVPMGPDQVYTLFQLGGRDTAAGYQLDAAQKTRGVPTHWNIYVAVTSADETAERVAGLGGTVVAPPFDVAEQGRMAIVQDPTGASFSIWQPKQHSGIKVAGVDGTLCWADLNSPDRDKAIPFYSALFGWQFLPGKDGDTNGYLHIKIGEEFIGGATPSKFLPPGAPAHWLAYFLVSDCDASTEKAKSLGASVWVPPSDIEGAGRFSVLSDPQGAAFALFKSSR